MSIVNALPAISVNDIVDHLSEVIRGCEGTDDPYSQFYMRNCFPAYLYELMIANFPEASYYVDLKHAEAIRADGTSTRKYIGLSAGNLDKLPDSQAELWSKVSEALTSPKIKSVIFENLKTDLANRFGCSESEVTNITAYPHPALFRDEPGYRISPHPDTQRKIVTVQFYLPVDLSQKDLGTSTYVLVRHSKVHEVLRKLQIVKSNRNESKFMRIRTFDFAPNSGYGFAVSHKSLHGRDLVSPDAGYRNSILLIYSADPDAGY